MRARTLFHQRHGTPSHPPGRDRLPPESAAPLHRGRDAVEWAIRMRDRVTGGTVYWMDDRADGGPVVCQEFCFVRPNDTAEDLWRRDLGPMGVRLLEQAVSLISQGGGTGTPQDESLHTWEPAIHLRKALSDGAMLSA